MAHEQNIKDIISEISNKEVIQNPRYIISIWSEELKNKMNLSKYSLKEEYENKIPTSTNILKNKIVIFIFCLSDTMFFFCQVILLYLFFA